MADLVLGFTADIGTAKTALLALGREVLNFAKGAVQAFAEQEKADARLSSALRQLGHDAKALAPAFQAQADAFEKSLGVSGEMVQSIQSLMLRYGTAPKDIKATTAAILDYAAATGQDAEQATRTLLQEVQRGDGSVAKLGITYTSTGDKTRDLALATQALADKWGGAAAENAETLTGQTQILGAHFDDLKKALGGFLVDIERSTGIIKHFALTAQAARLVLFGDEAQEKYAAQTKAVREAAHMLGEYQDQLKRAQEAAAQGKSFPIDIGIIQANVRKYEAELEKALGVAMKARDVMEGNVTAGGAGGGGATEAAKRAREKARKEAADSLQKALAESIEAQRDHAEEGKRLAKETSEAEEREAKKAEEAGAPWLAFKKRQHEKSLQLTREAFDRLDQDALAQEQAMSDAGVAVGSAFTSALAAEISKMRSGGEMDFGAVLGSVLATGLAVALNIALPGSGAIAAPLLMAVGGAFSTASPRRRHAGGFVEPYEFHAGGEVPAILQSGEYVLSRSDVSRFGGPAAIDSMRHGRGAPININVSTLDGQSFRDFLTDRGGRGFYNAVRTGRGPLAAMMRKR